MLLNFNPAQAAARWIEVYSITGTQLYSVHATSVSTLYAVGSNGAILKSQDEGFNFTLSATPVAGAIWYDVYFPTADTGFVFGEGDPGGGSGRIIYKTTSGGGSWSQNYYGLNESFRAGYFTDASTGWAVGTSGTSEYTTNGGTTWNPSSGISGDYNLWDVMFPSGLSTGWAVGSNGEVHKSTDSGVNYSSQPILAGYTAYGVHVFNSGSAIIVGDDNSVYRTTDGGSSWNLETVSGASASTLWQGVDFTSYSKGWMVGRASAFAGELFKSLDGGENWSEDPAVGTLSLPPMSHVDMYDENNGWAIGHDQATATSKVYKLVTDPTVSPASSYTTNLSAQNITVYGINFHPTVTATTSSASLAINSVTYVSPMEITLNVTATTPATSAIIVSNPDGGASSSSLVFTGSTTDPVIDAVNPDSGVAGSIASLSITGSNFDTVGSLQVRLQKAILGSLTTISATSVDVSGSSALTCKVDLVGALDDSNWLTTWDLIVENPDGRLAVKSDAFTIDPRGAADMILEGLSFDGIDYDFSARSSLDRHLLTSDRPTIIATFTAVAIKSDPAFAILVDANRDGTYERTVYGSEISGISYLADTSSAPNTMQVTLVLPSLSTLGISDRSSFNLAFYAEDLNDVATRPVTYLGWSSTRSPTAAGPIASIVGGPSPLKDRSVKKMYFNIDSNVAGPTKFRIWGSSGMGATKVIPVTLVVGSNTVEWDITNVIGEQAANGMYTSFVDLDPKKTFRFPIAR